MESCFACSTGFKFHDVFLSTSNFFFKLEKRFVFSCWVNLIFHLGVKKEMETNSM